MNTRLHGPIVLLCAAALAGCDNTNGAGATGGGGGAGSGGLRDTPTTMFGKAVKSGKDTKKLVSEGGNSREAVVLDSKIKLEQMAATITELRARAKGESAERAVADAQKKHKKASDMAEKMQDSTLPDDGTEVKMLRDAVKAVQDAIDHAKELLGG